MDAKLYAAFKSGERNIWLARARNEIDDADVKAYFDRQEREDRLRFLTTHSAKDINAIRAETAMHTGEFPRH
jgi:hypothetical protein